MRIEYRSDGGVAGLSRACVVDAGLLPDRAKDELMGLLALAEKARSRSRGQPSNTGADLIQYRISVHTGGKIVALYFDDATLPANCRTLLKYLAESARPVPLPEM